MGLISVLRILFIYDTGRKDPSLRLWETQTALCCPAGHLFYLENLLLSQCFNKASAFYICLHLNCRNQ